VILRTRRQTAEALGCGTKHISHLIASGALEAYDLSLTGGRSVWRIPQEAIDQLLASRKHKVPKPKRRRRVKVDEHTRSWF